MWVRPQAREHGDVQSASTEAFSGLELEVGAKLAAPPLTAGACAGRRRRVGSAANEAEVAGTGAGGAPEEESSRSSDDDEDAALSAKRDARRRCIRQWTATPEGAAAAAQGGGVGGPGEYGNMLFVDSRALFETAKAQQEQRRTVGRPPAVASTSTGFTVVTSGPKLGKTSRAKVTMEW
jgi:hypothetical protein